MCTKVLRNRYGKHQDRPYTICKANDSHNFDLSRKDVKNTLFV